MEDYEEVPLSLRTKRLAHKEINKYKLFFLISLTINIVTIIINYILAQKLYSEKENFKRKLSLLILENTKKNEFENNNNLNYNSTKNDFIVSNENINQINIDEGTPVLNISKDEYLKMCYKSREYYFDKYRYNQNKITPGRQYLDLETGTIQSKLNYLIIHESPDYNSKIVDKIKLREYVTKILGKNICVPIIKIYNNATEINFDELPNQFVLKCNHGAAMNIIVNNKTKLNKFEAKDTLNKWLNRNFGLEGAEFQYINVEKKIFAEEFLVDDILDYKIYCFHGEPKFIKVQKKDKIKNLKIGNYYTLDWNLTDMVTNRKTSYRDPNIHFEKPKNLDLMISYAKRLSVEFVFVRVDFFNINGNVYLSELTFTPSNVCFKLKDMKQAKEVGSFVDITKIKKYLYT